MQCLTILLALFLTVEARHTTASSSSSSSARQLLVNPTCPPGCDVANGGCVLDGTGGGYRCTSCLNSLVVSDADGTCGCPAGRYAAADSDCSDCPKGSWCAGGIYGAVNTPAATECGGLLTTLGKRSMSIKACVNSPGSFYTLDTSSGPAATTCPADTWGAGLKKQRACVPCPPGFTTNGTTGRIRAGACVVPEGYYLKGPGQVAPCPQGEYKAGFAAVAACTKCASGVTTAKEASTAEGACAQVLPGYYPETVVSNTVKSTQLCPQKFVCAGGVATNAFNVSAPAPSSGNTVAACPDGTWTQGIGASDASQCMTPPGHKTVNGATIPCANGEWRADWKVPSQASAGACISCGEGVQSDPTDQVTAYAITPDATPAGVDVRTSAAACYIKAGQGMYYSAASSTYRAVNCDSNTYGAANKTFGLAAFPCRDCPAGMQTSTTLPNSALYWSTDSGSPVRQGFTSPMACVTQAGYGYNGRVANRCPAGSWNPAGVYGTCTKCAVGLSTPNSPAAQVSSDNCTIAIGFGFLDGVVQPCPVGTYNDVLRASLTDPCTPCGQGLTTSQAGGASTSDCNLCAAGWGNTSCAQQCGGAAATYGPAGNPRGTDCTTCPTMSVGFSFDLFAVNQPFTPASVARLGADNAGDCLAEFAQIVDSAWQLGGAVSLANVLTAASWDDCVADCRADAACQYLTYDYTAAPGSQCWKKVNINGSGTDLVGFKAVVAGDSTASSIRNNKTKTATVARAAVVVAAAAPAADPRGSVKTKALASGAYTFWQDAGAGIGDQQVPMGAGIASVQACLDACDADSACAGVVLTGLGAGATTDSVPGSCSLIRGDSRIAQFKRSVTKAVVTRLTLAAALGA